MFCQKKRVYQVGLADPRHAGDDDRAARSIRREYGTSELFPLLGSANEQILDPGMWQGGH
jgi:hypothetical protein